MDSTGTSPKRALLKRRSFRLALLVVVAAFAAFWYIQPAATPPRGSGEFMQAIVYDEYGPPEVLRLERIERYVLEDHQVLVKVHAAAANPLDWHYLRGLPYVMRLESGLSKPKDRGLGVDMASRVEAVGRNVAQFKPGDQVFGAAGGAFGEYVRASERNIALKPSNMTFEQAAGVPIAALTALQGLRDKGQLRPGQKVLINGASGGSVPLSA